MYMRQGDMPWWLATHTSSWPAVTEAHGSPQPPLWVSCLPNMLARPPMP